MGNRKGTSILGRLLLVMLPIFAGFLFWWMTESTRESFDSDSDATDELRQLCGEDKQLAGRLESRLYPAISIGQEYQRAGLETLDLFGDDATHDAAVGCLE
ncbi:MAG: hypothetical protein MK179_14945 [Pirellulaceae bacterium]|nr:hypothetical protein [Pirellulaceae bacterium]